MYYIICTNKILVYLFTSFTRSPRQASHAWGRDMAQGDLAWMTKCPISRFILNTPETKPW